MKHLRLKESELLRSSNFRGNIKVVKKRINRSKLVLCFCIAVILIFSSEIRNLWCAGSSTPSFFTSESIRKKIKDKQWHVYALEYAYSKNIKLKQLIHGADPDEYTDMSWYFYVALGHGKVVMIDSGTDVFQKLKHRKTKFWKVRRSTSVAETLKKLHLNLTDVSDIILTHRHWDHVGGIVNFPQAKIHMNKNEWKDMKQRTSKSSFGLILDMFEKDNIFNGLPGKTSQPIPGIKVIKAGRHTKYHSVVEIECPHSRIVLSGDGAYLYLNLEKGIPISVATDYEGNVQDMKALLRSIGSKGKVIPGHDPDVFKRFPTPLEGIAAICP